MNSAKIEIEVTHPHAILPKYMTPGSAAADVAAAISEPVTLEPGQRTIIPMGLKMKIAEGYEVQVRPRSGLALKKGITVLNSPGTIDSDYRGPCCVILINSGHLPFQINPGDRIAQIAVAPVTRGEFKVVSTIEDDTDRGQSGFGSTGRTSEAPS